MSELKKYKKIFETAWSCKNDCNIGYAYKKEKVCNIWIAVSKTQTLAIKNVRTKNCLKNIQNKMVMKKDCNIAITVSKMQTLTIENVVTHNVMTS